MAPSSIPTAKQAILDALAANTNLSGVKLSWGAPEGNNFEREHVIVGDAEGIQAWGPIRPPVEAKEETYTIQVQIVATKAGNDQRATELRAFELLEEVQSAIRPDPSLGSTIRFGHVRRLRQNNEVGPQSITSHLFLAVECRARI